MISRRLFLRRSASATAFAGVAVAAVQCQPTEAPAAPLAEDRARRAWAEFCDAMRELAGDADGWLIVSAGHRWNQRHSHQSAEPYLNVRSVHFVQEPMRGLAKPITVERHRYIVPLTDPRELGSEP